MAGFGLPSFGFGPGAQQGSDPIANQQAIQRKQKLLEAMQAATMQQPLVGRQGGVQALAKLVGLLAGQHRAGQLEKQGTENTDLYRSELTKEANQYLDRRQGTPSIPGTGPDVPDPAFGDAGASASGGQVAQKPDPRGAIIGAMTSRFPELQQIGKADFTQFGKQEAPEFKIVGDSLFKVYSDGRPPERVVQNEKPIVVNGQVVRGASGDKPQAVGDFRDRVSPLKKVGLNPDGTPIQAQVTEGTGENKYPPKGVNVSNSVNLGENAFAKEFGKERAQLISKSHEKATSASQALMALDEAQGDWDRGIKSGITADINLALSKIGKSFGLSSDPTIASTESYRANMARETLNLIKGLGSGTAISNSDREFAENASGGKITLDDQTMLRLMGVARAAAANVLMSHDVMLNKAGAASPDQMPGLEQFRIPIDFHGGPNVEWKHGRFIVTQPDNSTPRKSGDGGVMSLQDYLKRP